LNRTSMRKFINQGFSVVVLKPARQDVEDLVEICIEQGMKLVFTSSMDHLVGVAHAHSVAEAVKSKYPASVLQSGLLTHALFEEDLFSQRLKVEDSCLVFPKDLGIGFTRELESLEWRELL